VARPHRDARRRLLAAAAAAAVAAAAVPSLRAAAADAPGAAAALLPEGLLAPLRAGGCVLLLRHAQTEPGIGDPPGWRLGDCGSQRNLSAEGRAQAARLGDALRRAGIEVQTVRSSRWCRCTDTATLAFGRVEPWPVLDSFFGGRDTEPAQTAALRAWVGAFRGPGNAALVTHQVNMTALTGEGVSMGEVLVLRATPSGFALVGRFVS
jgi:phosphohistidine phosphatase SixA